jgi:predicted methyltransferase
MLAAGDYVFFCTNSAKVNDSFVAAFQTIQSLNLVPLAYAGVRLRVRNSNLDQEIRHDFYMASLAVIFLEAGQTLSMNDHWALPELGVRHGSGKSLLIYASASTPREDVRHLGLPVDAVFIEDMAQFASDLRLRLEQLMQAG